MPGIVAEEFNEGARLGYFPADEWSAIPRLDPTLHEVSALEQSHPTLDKGERACIALALRLQALVVTDDRDARRVARSLGLKVSGTLGALCELVDQKHLTIQAADEILAEMLVRGYRSPVTSIKALLER